jgi:glycosyltransferase involved in cell wall biosynthesis
MAAREIDGIICLSTDPWGDMKRPGQLMLRLAERVPIVYVEAQVSLTSLVKNWRHALSASSRDRLRRALSRRAEEVSPGIHVVTALVVVPAHRLSPLLSAARLQAVGDRQQAQASALAYRAAERLCVKSPALWVTYPLPLNEPPSGKRPAVVYDCMDRWTDFPDVQSDPKSLLLVEKAEQALLDRADVVLCSAAGLYASKRATAAGPVTLVRNGADVEHFAPTGRPTPGDLARLPRPIVGYVGAVAEWVDFKLIREAALSRPAWSFVLVGPSFKGKPMGDSRELDLISELPNVYLMGPRPYNEVPAYLEAFDVATIPFKLNGLTEDTNPIKVYEYLAAGVPVVSTDLPEVATLPHVRRVKDAPSFVAACEAASSERSDPGLIAERIEVADANSWEARAQVAWKALLEG